MVVLALVACGRTTSAQTVADGWTATAIGRPALEGFATSTENVYSISDAGSGIAGKADQFTFLHKRMTGDGVVVARVASMHDAGEWSMAGVMIRESLDSSSRHAFMFVSGSRGLAFRRRTKAGGNSVDTAGGSGQAPVWVKLERRSGVITASRSDDGANWTKVGSAKMAVAATAYVGLALANRNVADYATAIFSDIVAGAPAAAETRPNQPPTVSLAAPAADVSYTAPASVTLVADADDDGGVSRVDFYAGSTLLGSSWSAPYAYAWRDVVAGSYVVTAVARDSAGLTATSAARTITVTPQPQPPVVSLSTPAPGTAFTAPAVVDIAAAAMDADGFVSRVEFYAGDVLLGADSASPYVFAWTNVPAGTYEIRAVAHDGDGLTAVSSASVVTVDPEPAADPLVAHWDLDENAGSLATDRTGRYSGTLANGASWSTGRIGAGVSLDGIDDFIAVPALDVPGRGLTIAVWVKSTTTGAQRFVSKADGVDANATYWMLGESDGRLRFQLNAGGTTTTLTAPAALPVNAWYHAAATYDGSGMRVYLDGVEVAWAAKEGAIATSSAVPVAIGRSPDGAAGTHLAGSIDDVRVYGRALTPGEIAELKGSAPVPNQAPSVSLTTPIDGATLIAPATVAVAAAASDVDGSVARVEFYADGVSIGSDASSPYAITWPGVAPGTYTITARAFDDDGDSSASASRTVTIAAANQAPFVALVSPLSGATFIAPAAMTLTASASDADGAVVRVDFYSGSVLLGSDTAAPYSFAWSAPAGSHSLTAVARDDDGATTVSAAAGITVTAPQTPNVALFAPSSNHDTAVDRYVIEFFHAGADPAVSNPVSTADVGKPSVVNGECRADVSQVVNGLGPGTYTATVTAIGAGGSARSEASPVFTR